MKVQISNRSQKFNAKRHRKDDKPGLDHVYKVIEKTTMREIIDCRVYWTSGYVTCTACIWVRTNAGFISGSGDAGGYGYDKRSAAVADAIYNAGIDLGENISGVGDGAIREALVNIAKKFTKKQVHLIECYA